MYVLELGVKLSPLLPLRQEKFPCGDKQKNKDGIGDKKRNDVIDPSGGKHHRDN